MHHPQCKQVERSLFFNMCVHCCDETSVAALDRGLKQVATQRKNQHRCNGKTDGDDQHRLPESKQPTEDNGLTARSRYERNYRVDDEANQK